MGRAAWAVTAVTAVTAVMMLAACTADVTPFDHTPGTTPDPDNDPPAKEDELVPTTSDQQGQQQGQQEGVEITDQDPDRHMDPKTPSPPDDPTLTPATQDQLIKKFAPQMHLHPQDENKPANVDWYLSRVSMRFAHNNCPDHEVLAKGKVTQASLIAQTHEDNQSLCRHDGNKKVTSTMSDHFFLEIADDITKKGAASRTEWKTYVVWRPKGAGSTLIDVEYWLFYPFNDAFSVINHESDWEHVRQTIDPKANGGQGKLIETKLSAHKGGSIFKAGDPNLTLEGGTHPIVYVAKGTHANYAKPGTYDIEGTKGIAKDTAAAAPAASVWKTETTTLLVGTRAAPKNGQVFIKYWGFWGQMNSLPETDGVTRHFP